MKFCSLFFAIFLILMIFIKDSQPVESYSSTVEVSTTWTTNYSAVNPILRRETNVAVFTCGFFCPDNCTDNEYFFAIFISPTTESPGQSRFVWLADTDYYYYSSVGKNALLNFTAAGELVLENGDGSIVWTTNTAGKSVVGMNLTDAGNLVLFDDQNLVVWQSFDHPTDTLLPGQKLIQGQNLTASGSSFPLMNEMYSLRVTEKGVFGYVELTPPQAYYNWLPYGNIYTIEGSRYIMFLNGSLSFFIESSEPSDPVDAIGIPEASSAQYMKLMPDGHLKVFEWKLEDWKVLQDLTTIFISHSHTTYPSTTWDTNYSSVQPMLLRDTNGAQFACGFLCKGNCTNGNKLSSYIFSIFIFPASFSRPQYGFHDNRVVWSANRDRPVGTDAILNFTADGELVLRDGDGSIVWTTNTMEKSVAGMNLTDTGNLVLFDYQNSVVWQSFDHPTDCWLLGQKLFVGQNLTSIVVLTNQSNQEGTYSLQVTDKGLFAYIESNPPQAYYSRFSYLYGIPNTNQHIKYIRFLNGSLSFFIHASEPRFPDAKIDIPEASSTQFIKLMPNGSIQVIEWQHGWTVVTDLTAGFVDECGYPLVCGRNAICSSNQQCGCPGTEYFTPVDNRQPNMGCSIRTPLTCDSTQVQDFITLKDVKYFTLAADMEWVKMEACKQACQSNCSCKAAFFQYQSNASNGKCFLLSEIFTMKSIDTQDMNGLAFIKVQNFSSHRSSHQVATIVGSTIASFVILIVVSIGIITYVVHGKKGDAQMEEEYLDQLPGMPTRFSYEELKTATEDFTKKLGEGGFGSVFEGSLNDGSKIAVKCLEGLSHIKKSFIAEVQSIGSIHHVNLVRLRGFCTWKSKWFLVYDFMSNGSLDRWIYHGNRERTLEWKCRKKIILDIAKGLAYLHEECRQKIIHLDIKPQNILLDNDFNAKVSDFGLSKLMDRNQTQVMTTMRGTPGYLAPEWLSSVITEKVDVYSFGIVLLEILCGRKNFDRSLPEESWHLLRVFQNCWEQETLLDIVDMTNEDMQMNATEVVVMMKIASWCLQTDHTRRPSMSSVVKVLEGGMDVESNMDYNFTDPRLQKNSSHEKDLTPLLPSILSGPR